MSRNVGSTSSRNNYAVNFTSFFGGSKRGRSLQLDQQTGPSPYCFATVQMTEQQVREAVQLMQTWLED